MDVVTIDRTNENFRILYDVKGRFVVHRIKAEEAKYKLCHPLVKVNDTIMLDIATGKMKEFIKFDTEKDILVHFDIVHIKDALGHTFATRLSYVFAIGKGSKPWISLPRGKGVKLTIAEERDRRIAAKTQ
ncbi:40S ribosomal protein S4 [Bulinus truncatus]|nr:40S ribosomal protein S4 [Bulinus truncatus]